MSARAEDITAGAPPVPPAIPAELVECLPPEELDDAGVEGETAEVETAEERRARQSLYEKIKRKLVARGIPAHEIAFVHDADTTARRAKLIADVNAGRIRVLLGSTSKMGTAMNCQERLVALHHLDAPWRPRDVEQRNGRIERQGNIYDEVHVLQYVTKGSFDGYIWQILESKARFISQIMAGEVTARTAEDVGDMVLTAAQVKAIASGNPLVMEHVAVGIELTKLDRLRAAFYNDRAAMRYDLTRLPGQVQALSSELAGHDRAIKARLPLDEGNFQIKLKKALADSEYTTVTTRQDAGRLLRHLSDVVVDHARRSGGQASVTEEVGEYRGLKVYIHVSGNSRFSLISSLFDFRAEVQLRAEPAGNVYVASIGDSDAGVTQSMDYQLRNIEERVAAAASLKASLEKRLSDFQAEAAKPWGYSRKYSRLRKRYLALGEQLQKAGVAVEAGATFSELEEDELTACEDEVEEVEAAEAAPGGAGDLETRSRNHLTGLETDPIVVIEGAAATAVPTTATEPAAEVVAPVSVREAQPAEPAAMATAGPQEPTGPQRTLFADLPAARTSRRRARRKHIDQNQLGFNWAAEPAAAHAQSPLFDRA